MITDKPKNDGVTWTPHFIFILTVTYLNVIALTISNACLNAPADQIKNFMNETEFKRTGEIPSPEEIDSKFGLLVAVIGIGAAIGCLTGSGLGDWLGKKKALMVCALIGCAGVLPMAFAEAASAFEMLFVGRAIVGLVIGWALPLGTAYITEMCTPNMKGTVVMVNQMLQSCSFLIAQIFGYQELLGNDQYWTFLLGFPAILFGVQMILLPFCPETPRFQLLRKNDEASARKTLQSIRGRLDVQKDIEDIHLEIKESSVSERVSIVGLFTTPLLRKSLIVGIAMGLQQNWCGMNAILFFSDSLFRAVGVSTNSARYATSGTGLVFVLGNIGAVFLLPCFGRKTLFIAGTIGMGILSAVVALSNIYQDEADLKYVNVVASLGIVACYALGPICVYWILLAELFPHSARGAGMSIAILCAFSGFFVHCYALPAMQATLKSYTFFVFTAIDVLMAIFCAVFMPETKNRSFAEITQTSRMDLEFIGGDEAAVAISSDVDKMVDVPNLQDEEEMTSEANDKSDMKLLGV